MGYYMEQMTTDFYICKENVEPALKALKDLFRNNFKATWVDENDVINSRTFKEAMDAVYWPVEIDSDGDCYDINFSGEKYSGNEEKIFETIAPYVSNGSFIQMQGEDGEMWRWKFENGKCFEVTPTIIW